MTAQMDGSTANAIDVDDNGEFASQLAEGHYTIKVNATGYVEQTFAMDLKLNGLKTLNVELVKI